MFDKLLVYLRLGVQYAVVVALDELHGNEFVLVQGVLVVERLVVVEHVALGKLLHYVALLLHRLEVALQVLDHLLLLGVQDVVRCLVPVYQLAVCLLLDV